MENNKNLNVEVTEFINRQEHPLKKEIEHLRATILESNSELKEIIKWNAPSYVYRDIDCITFKLYPQKAIHLIFHCGAKVRIKPKEKLINDTSGLLTWKENDRAMATFPNLETITSNKDKLKQIVQSWINALKSHK